jgi:hypothetical protein
MSLKRLWHTGLFIRLPVPEIHEELTAEIKLHRAVLDRALLDMFHPKDVIRLDVKTWLELRNPDFIEACERADLEPKSVYELFLNVQEIFKDQINEIPKSLL